MVSSGKERLLEDTGFIEKSVVTEHLHRKREHTINFDIVNVLGRSKH